jgi:Rod binding domain-containing protein
VAQTFFGTLLKQIRNSPFKSEVLSGGRGGEAFGSLYDQHLADRMASASGRRLAQSIVRHLEKAQTKASNESSMTGLIMEGGDVAATR